MVEKKKEEQPEWAILFEEMMTQRTKSLKAANTRLKNQLKEKERQISRLEQQLKALVSVRDAVVEASWDLDDGYGDR